MAAGGGGEAAFAPVLAALATMQSNADRTHKDQAHHFLEQFQKSVRTEDTVRSRKVTDHRTERFMDVRLLNAISPRRIKRGEALRSDYTQGQGQKFVW